MAIDKNMFDSIRNSLKNKNSGNETALYKVCLKTKAGNVYVGRLIPNIKNTDKTFAKYFKHGFKSVTTGQYIEEICLSTIGERCPICETRFKLYKEDPVKFKQITYNIKRKEEFLVNFYVLEDPTNKENINTIKILKYAEQINKKIDSAMNGEDAKDLGPRIFDFSENGCNFKVKVENVSDAKRNSTYVSYSESAFKFPSKIEGMTEEKEKSIHENIFDLESFLKCKSYEALEKIVNDHILGSNKIQKQEPAQVGAQNKQEQPKNEVVPPSNKEDDLDMGESNQTSDMPPDDAAQESEEDATVRKMLEGLDNI